VGADELRPSSERRDVSGEPVSRASAGSRSSLLFGTTSYVLPADLLPNVRLLAPFVDDIELVLFEGEDSNLPSRSDVDELRAVAGDAGCGFTVHLPLDVGIGELDRSVRRRAQDTCLRVLDLTATVEPRAYVVHPELPLSYHPPLGEAPAPLSEFPPDLMERWREALGESLGRLAVEAADVPLAVENLQYPFAWLRTLLDEFDLGVTMDVGHLLLHGGSVDEHLADFGDRLTVVHLHGIVDGRDHREIGAFPLDELASLVDSIAVAPTGKPVSPGPADADRDGKVVVSLEVFGWEHTVPSLRTLAGLLADVETERSDRFAAAADAVLRALPEWLPPEG
jgi:sugar phosphate isomerase/epimerase